MGTSACWVVSAVVVQLDASGTMQMDAGIVDKLESHLQA